MTGRMFGSSRLDQRQRQLRILRMRCQGRESCPSHCLHLHLIHWTGSAQWAFTTRWTTRGDNRKRTTLMIRKPGVVVSVGKATRLTREGGGATGEDPGVESTSHQMWKDSNMNKVSRLGNSRQPSRFKGDNIAPDTALGETWFLNLSGNSAAAKRASWCKSSSQVYLRGKTSTSQIEFDFF